MGVNNMTYSEISTILSDIVSQATGKTVIAPVNTAQFTSVANTALKIGYDPMMQAISQVLGRTIFVIRPYNRKFRGLSRSVQEFAGYTRKLQVADSDWDHDPQYELEDGKSVDMYKVKKSKVLQMNFYGQANFKRQITTYLHQLDLSFRNPDELAMFWSMITQNASDQIEQAHEVLSRAIIGNFIGAKTICDPDSCIHLLTEYNNLTGQALTQSDVYLPENYPAFVKWTYGRVASISSMMTERTVKYQVLVDGYNTPHHTPYTRQQVYLYAPEQYAIASRVLSDVYHPSFLNRAYNEEVNFWQSPDNPDELDVNPVYIDNTGNIVEGNSAQVGKIFGVILDAEACGYTVVNEWNSTTPLNSDGGYWNTFFHFTDRYINDFTEKGVVLLLD